MWFIRLDWIQPSDNQSWDIEGGTKILSLQNGVVSFVSDNVNTSSEQSIIISHGGAYRSFPFSYWPGSAVVEPSITAEVLQAQ